MPAGSQSVAPIRAAATVVVIRQRDQGLYGVVRSPTASFMPNALVFPGGRVEEADCGDVSDDRPAPLMRSQAIVAPSGVVEPSAVADLAFRNAGARELAEEANMTVAASSLHWFDTWLTPSAEARRFLARFYFARVNDEIAEQAQHDGEEVTGSRWGRALELLSSCGRGELDLPPPTLSILQWLASETDSLAVLDRSSAAPDDELERPILPKFVLDSGQGVIILPHSKHYPSAPGESAAAPRRLWERAYPTRVIRSDGRWTRVSD